MGIDPLAANQAIAKAFGDLYSRGDPYRHVGTAAVLPVHQHFAVDVIGSERIGRADKEDDPCVLKGLHDLLTVVLSTENAVAVAPDRYTGLYQKPLDRDDAVGILASVANEDIGLSLRVPCLVR